MSRRRFLCSHRRYAIFLYLLDYCPEDYPWSFKNGRYCSSSWKEDPFKPGNKCLGTFIQPNSTCSLDSTPMKCSNPPCRTSTAVCPDDFPFAYQDGQSCCSAPLEKDHLELLQDRKKCNGRMMTWHSSCCKDGVPFKCLNPPCRDAAIASQAKTHHFFEHLEGQEAGDFISLDVFLVKKGWHGAETKRYIQNERPIRSKRQVDNENVISTNNRQKSMNNDLDKQNLSMKKNFKKDFKKPIDTEVNDKVLYEAQNIYELMNLGTITTEYKQSINFTDAKNDSTSLDRINALRKVLGDSYKCKLEKCNKIANEFKNGKPDDVTVCLNPPCPIIMVKDDSINVLMPDSSPNFLSTGFLVLIVVGVVLVSCACCCGCCCIVREASKYFAKKEERREKVQKKEEFYLAHKDNYLEREQRLQKENNVDNTITTICTSADEGFGSRFGFNRDVPPPQNQMTMQKPMMMYSNDGRRIMRSSTLRTNAKGSNYKVHTLGRGAGIHKPYQDFYRSNQGLHKLTIDKRCQSEYIIDSVGTNRAKKGRPANQLMDIGKKEQRLSKASAIDEVHYDEFSKDLQKSDRRKFQSSSNLDSEGNQDSSAGKSGLYGSRNKSDQSSTKSDVVSNPSTQSNYITSTYKSNLSTDAMAGKSELKQVLPSLSASDSTTNSVFSPCEGRQLPPAPPPPIPTAKKPSVQELRQILSKLHKGGSRDNQETSASSPTIV